MKKNKVFILGMVLLALGCAGTLSAQNRRSQSGRENIAILPFTGGASGEGDAIAEIFSFSQSLKNYFGIIPRTNIASAINREQSFQMSSGMTDADTIAALGEQLGAKYVMAGSISALGSQKILVVTIVKIESIEQVAGAYVTYTREEELPSKVEAMVKELLPMVGKDRSKLQKLALVPVVMERGSDPRAADTLAQILSISLLRMGEYAIYPRTSSLEKVQQEYNNQLSGITADDQAAKLGYGVNPEYVLSVVTRKLGTMTMFNASIIDLESGMQKTGTSKEYTAIEDGIKVMDIIADAISGSDEDRERRAKAEAAEQERRAIVEAAEREQRAIAEAAERERREKTEAADRARREKEEKKKKAKADREATTDEALKNTGFQLAFEGGAGFALEDSGGAGYNAALKFGPYWRYFSLESGAQINIQYKKALEADTEKTSLSYTFLQVPALLRIGTTRLVFPSLSVFGGMGFNFPLSSALDLPLMSGIVGGEIGWQVGGFYLLFQGQVVFDLGDTTLDFADKGSYTFSGSRYELGGSIRFRLPFRRD